MSDPSINIKLKISDTTALSKAVGDHAACIAFCEKNEPKLSFCLALSQVNGF